MQEVYPLIRITHPPIQGRDIDISDDLSPFDGGSFVKCDVTTVFCNGRDAGFRQASKNTNTDCMVNGLEGRQASPESCP